MSGQIVTIDGNEAAAYVAHKTNEVIAIYPITPSSPMGEWADQWSAEQKPNIWGTIPVVVEMQSEGGAAGAVHGALQTGSLTTTFTASQGLLLMIPNMYKIAGELTSAVFHIAARSVAAQALSIFGDHSDVMATRATGFAMLFANSVQEVMDFALIAQASTLKARVPFLHIMDGFRTSHEINKVEKLSDDVMQAMIDPELIRAHRARALNPEKPFIRGTAQNPDVFFQARERVNPYYLKTPDIVQETMDEFAKLTGREYKLFQYVGAPDAERVIIMMGSGAETAEETVKWLVDRGEKVGLIKVRLYRPFSVKHLMQALPATVKKVATLDRTKEPGGPGEPLYLDVGNAISEAMRDGIAPFKHAPLVVGGRYGLSSKEFTPGMVKGVFDELKKDHPKNHFTVGIYDDVTHTSIDFDPDFDLIPDDVFQGMFWGLGSDGTVGANKNSIKIIGEETDFHAQGYFVYDSRKAGAWTISHLRFGPRPIHNTYLIKHADFVAVHQFEFLFHRDMLAYAKEGATFLLNAPYPPEEVWDHLPREVQETIIKKKLKFYAIDAYSVAKETGMGHRINTIMQTCFFAISGILPRDEAIGKIKEAIVKTYSKKGEKIVEQNFAAVDASLAHLYEIPVPDQATSELTMKPPVPEEAPDFVKNVLGKMIAGEGDELPVSALPEDGTYPSATTRWEKRNLALEVPVWEEDICIQCGKCVLVCPHAVIRAKVFEPELLENAPEGFQAVDARWKEFKGMKYTLQVAVEDCTGCTLCVVACPVTDKKDPNRKAINMRPQLPLREKGRRDWDFFLELPEVKRTNGLKFTNVKNIQLLDPLFEFSSACPGCGETPYIKLMTQLFGDRVVVANATGCSSIYGGNLPTTPWTVNKDGRGPAWSNSLFEDNAEFGLGMALTIEKQTEYARELVDRLRDVIGDDLANRLLTTDQSTDAGIELQRQNVAELKAVLQGLDSFDAKDLLSLADMLVRRGVWIIGGDGWAYDIGYGGLDHVLASGRNVNVLVMDTEVYSNTGGQASKATPMAAAAKFAIAGKSLPKKDLGMMAMSYGYVYVAQVAFGASDSQTVKAFIEAESYDGPSLIIAYSHCIAHGYGLEDGIDHQKLAVQTGFWPLYRYDPRRRAQGKNPLVLDSRDPKKPFSDYAMREARFRMLFKTNPDHAEELLDAAQKDILEHWEKLKSLAQIASL
ncbi:MAG TPA: pyruvate:ferredoxin (flavodoxin) oxidoreductase [Caldilineales bacterium]|nr:pyruvate:ferredoxin (flavodoxin) oxidoreductase [Caldilineales bacterium]